MNNIENRPWFMVFGEAIGQYYEPYELEKLCDYFGITYRSNENKVDSGMRIVRQLAYEGRVDDLVQYFHNGYTSPRSGGPSLFRMKSQLPEIQRRAQMAWDSGDPMSDPILEQRLKQKAEELEAKGQLQQIENDVTQNRSETGAKINQILFIALSIALVVILIRFIFSI